jgi:glycosyltransferase involved in cell wall biosynthesis/tetratricopeptide (TPR) repeat protein
MSKRARNKKKSPRQEQIEKIKIETPISVCIIMKNCAKQTLNLLKSLRPILVHPMDEVVIVDTGSTDGTPKKVMTKGVRHVPSLRVIERPDLNSTELVAKLKVWKPALFQKFGGSKTFKKGIIRSFAEARQISFDAARNDVCMWLDTDDVITGTDGFRALVQRYLSAGPENNAFFMPYNYAQDPEDLACTTVLWRERVIDRRKYRWAGRCHEVLIPRVEGYMGNPGLCGERDITIHHVHGMRHAHEISDLRNYAILRDEFERCKASGEWIDPRTLFYLGNACRGLGEYEEAIRLYDEFEPLSGNPDDRVLACLYRANIYQELKRPWRSLHLLNQAEMINPEDPRPSLGKAQCYFIIKKYKLAIHHAQRAIEMGREFKSFNSMNPVQVDYLPWHLTAIAAKELNDVQTALQAAEQLVRCRPDVRMSQGTRAALQDWANRKNRAESIKGVISLLNSKIHQRNALINMEGLDNLEEFGLAKPEVTVSDSKQKKPTVAMFCGGSWEDWGPKSPDGIGGSEQMVRDLVPELAKLGLDITVYAPVPKEERRVHKGVTWRHHLEFNDSLPRDYLVGWRHAQILQFPVPAKKRYLWLHDIGGNQIWKDPAIKALCSKAIFLSPWHREFNSECPDSKCFVSRNSIDVPLIERVEKDEKLPPRNPLRFVYSSSPDRQLHYVLAAWERAMERGILPEEAELVIMYGFNAVYMGMADRAPYINVFGKERSRMDYMEDLLSWIDRLPNVVYGGRMPKAAVLGSFLSSGAMLYTPDFTETFCISAAEAQACGCVPLTNDCAALATTNRYGVQVPRTGNADGAYHLLCDYLANHEKEWRDGARQVMEKNAREVFSTEALAKEWKEALFDE